MARTINDAIIGAIVGNVSSYASDDSELDEKNLNNYILNSITLQAMSELIQSIKKYDGFWLEDNRVRLASIDGLGENDRQSNDGSVLCWIYLASFTDIFMDHGIFDSGVKQICSATHNCEESINLCVEYCHLLHDIFCNRIGKDGILSILPELDILAGDVPIDKNIRRVFFAGLWAFVNSNDYKSAIDNCNNFKDNNEFTNWITTVAGTLAGLYYGVDTIPYELLKKLNINDYLKNLTF